MSSATLAIVDDDKPFAEYLQTLLRSRGYDTATYDSGDALLAALREGALPDVILLDVLMPGLDGLETLRAIRLAHPAAQVVMLSGGQTPGHHRRGRPPRRHRLRRQARRSRRRRRGGARSGDSQRARTPVAHERGAAPAHAGRPGSRWRAALLELRPGDAAGDDHGRSRRRQRRQRAAARRERRRQGSDRARDSSPLAPARRAVRQGELRGAAGGAARKRAVRPRARRVHRRRLDARRQVRVRAARHHHARRDRRDAAGAAGQDPARAAGPRVHQAGQQPHHRSRRAGDRRHQSRPRGDDARRHVPRGPLLPPAGHRGAHSAPARAPRGDRRS